MNARPISSFINSLFWIVVLLGLVARLRAGLTCQLEKDTEQRTCLTAAEREVLPARYFNTTNAFTPEEAQ